MRNWIWILTAIAVMALMAGCHGGSSVTGEPGDTAIQPIADPRLSPSDDPETATIEGLIKLIDLTLVVTDNGLAGGGSAVSQIPEERILVRVIDPSEDILIATVNPDLAGRFTIADIAPLPAARLEIEFSVLEDLNGNEVNDDLISQSVPLALDPGSVSMIEMEFSHSLSRPLPGVPVDDPGLVQSELLPEAGYLLMTELKIQDGNGYHEDFYGVNYLDNSVIYDTDGDGYLELGEDYKGEDADNDGWTDPFEDLYSKPAVSTLQYFAGYVTSVDTGSLQLTLLQDDSTAVVVLVDPFIAIEELNSEAAGGAGQFFGPQPFDRSLVGKYVQVEAAETAEGYRALWIVVLDDMTAGVN